MTRAARERVESPGSRPSADLRPPELARAHLLYGERPRRERPNARLQLRAAHDMLDAMGIEAFAELARRELVATGETAQKRSVETDNELTAQEAPIAWLARDGLCATGPRGFVTSSNRAPRDDRVGEGSRTIFLCPNHSDSRP
ncbi:MAG: regulatory protein LuxR [Acidimicrobiaceae bacterium]|jgi:hypothetical protein|nr:regulatory protein LuxR [Acidimicrobiaceae bacterium]